MAKAKPVEEAAETQAVLPGADETIKAEIASELKLAYQFQEARREAGAEEKKHRNAAFALMEKYGYDDKFVFGEGSEKVGGKFRFEKKLKVRVGEKADFDDEETKEAEGE